MEDALAH